MKKVFLLFFVSLCFWVVSVVLWANPSHAAGACQVFPGDGYANPDAFGVSGHGPALKYRNNGNGTATDKNTKCIWEIKTNVTGSVHNVDNTYTWTDTGTDPDGTLFTVFLDTLNNKCDGDETASCTNNANCAGIGNGLCGLAGHRDWRIPNVKELQSIVDYEGFCPTIDPTFPGLTKTAPMCDFDPFYWSATTFAGDGGNAWDISFNNGDVHLDNKGFDGGFARAVRACP